MGDHYGETDSRVLQRDCAAVSVPWGKAETLPEGAYALVTQRLGGSITVMCGGNLYRIDERNADALGLEPQLAATPPVAADGEQTAESVEQAAWAQLATCYDPEIPIDIVNLGLVLRLHRGGAARRQVPHRRRDDPHRARLRHGHPDRRRGA